jgi:hypothetical protein
MNIACFFRQNKKDDSEESAGVSPALLFVIAVLALSFIFFALPINKMIVVKNARTKDILFSLPVKNEEIVDIKFTHSVNLSPVIDRYRFNGKYLVLESTIFKTYGAGIPILDDGLGKGFKHTEDGFEIFGIDVPREKIPIMLQTVPNHSIFYRKSELHLLDFAKSGTVIEISIGNLSFMKRFLTSLKTP